MDTRRPTIRNQNITEFVPESNGAPKNAVCSAASHKKFRTVERLGANRAIV